MTKLQYLLEAANELWGDEVEYNPWKGRDETVPKENSPWIDWDQETISEVLMQNDNTFMEKGANVILAAFEYLKEAREKGEI